MLKKLKSFFNPLLDIIYPQLCISCDLEDPLEGIPFCINCLDELPFSQLFNERDNIVEKFFWGRVAIEKATSLFYFQKGSLVQEMLHNLKYKNQKSIGSALGIYYGKQLLDSNFINDIDIILPVPIHASKKTKRLYNQSAVIAEGISSVTNTPWNDNTLIKNKQTVTQTEKTREERLQNLSQTFIIQDPDILKGKHVLIIDDILTTGATLETICKLVSEKAQKVSVAVVAVGKY